MIIQEERIVKVPAIDSTDVFHFIDQIDPTRMNKINTIKAVRAEWGIGLKEAKDLVEGVPKEVKSGVNKKEAEEIKKKLEAVGAKVELK